MCIGGSPKASAPPPPPPPPAPTPQPIAADPNPVQTADQRRSNIQQAKFGSLSTIKTSPGGITGSGADLNKQAAGAVYGNKKTLGS